eukprot:TRINITY_DN702_c0_g1_i1.p1 TRINITY_DN702_c0_g1~~TRINITY_DN702_c0_g1_i1.p1  ORF type:complete len:371 (-),score=60.88 TRINITY_DN702_c0_g1_i1:5-1117(-)
MTEENKVEEELKSYVEQDGVWQTVKISIWGVARSIIQQLRNGAELTKLSLPAVFLEPYSVLELGAARLAGHFPILHDLPSESDPLGRMIITTRWYLAAYKCIAFSKKPYNSILGETHRCTVNEGGHQTKFYAQQVSHHPPKSAFRSINSTLGIVIEALVGFEPKFHGNYVTVPSSGYMKIHNKKYEEEYFFAQPLPGVLISNVIWGTRVHEWTGTYTIVCEKSQLRTIVSYSPKGQLKGAILSLKDDSTLITFQGNTTNPVFAENKVDNTKFLLIDYAKSKPVKMCYPSPSVMDETDSLKIWKDVTKAIVANDLIAADLAKEKVEKAQRERRAKNIHFPNKYFVPDDKGNWDFCYLEEQEKETKANNNPV